MITASDAAAAAQEVQHTGIPIAVVLLVCDGVPAQRMIISGAGAVRGTFADAMLDDAARALAADALSVDASGEALSRTVTAGDRTHLLYAEVYAPIERLIVVGAGHIAVPLAALGVMLGFDVTVLDDRAEFATAERFDARARVLRSDFETDPFAGVTIDERTYIALVTRGHAWDFDCLTRVLRAEVMPRYIGMIGSRRRVRAAFEALTDAAIPSERLAAVRAPIGLDINADTPAEIALSIAAEMVAVRRGATPDAQPLTTRERVLDRLMPMT